ncbi:Dyp-type peroxidase [Microbacterium thalassium]|uniref:Dyp-type peroxidase family n=1 Tax=Microbacterium thalassium TaxID=362649 RepID=A0A7X0FQN0_9MICO|nr:Dyp-type peroxidase [Microbacterium thalassium]MBB6391918.1 Dyp-type peroxidase family [Microbacterium thalassium]GLK23938.1 peroxidase [Microbacterium thalassium]
MLGRPENLPARSVEPATIDLGDIQGNVLRGYTMPAAAYVFLTIVDAPRARALLRRVLPLVQTAELWDATPEHAVNVAFSHEGLRAMGVTEDVLASFPEVFSEGIAPRAERLGDTGTSAPSEWEFSDPHALLTVCAVDTESLESVLAELRAFEAEGAVEFVHIMHTLDRTTGHDHFGFFDGVSQPAIAGAGVRSRRGDGQPDGNGGWREVATGEVLLGYPDEDGRLPEAPAAPFERNGTFVVVRKLAMDVAGFRRFVRDAGYPGGPDKLAAKMVGRWPDGTPLAISPEAPDAAISADPERINDFAYDDDPEGLRCPVGAHVRRSNPRDSKGFFHGRLTNRHRMVRRGRSYGTPLDEDRLDDDGTERGLMFVSFQTDIWRQFETVQALWMNDGDPLGVGADKDFLASGDDDGGKMTIPGHPPFFLKPLPRFVTTRGGAYLFQPSMSALRWLGDLA